jgi:predicted NBD/HSP70 family sugar kinase
LVNVLNPELIILGGMFAQGQDLFIPKAEATMRETAFAGLGKKVKVLPTSFGWRAGVIGASSLALTTFFFQNPEG